VKIAIIAPYLASKGGAARYTWELSEYLASCGDTVIIISLYTDRTVFNEKENIRIIDISNSDNLTQSIKFWFKLKTIRKKLKMIIENEIPDIILFMNFPATLWAQKFGRIPILCYPQDINLLYTNTYIKNLSMVKYIIWIIIRLFVRIYDKKTWKNFDEVICNSKFSEQHIKKYYNVKTSVIHLGTRTEFFKPSNSPKKRAILSIAAQKAQRTDFLIRSMKNIFQKRKDFEIWIVGNYGKHEEELKKLVRENKMENIVKFFGVVSDSKLVELYSNALLVVHLVKNPPFGMIVTEAMSCGTPVIACLPGGTEETMINGETGFHIESDESEALIKKIELLLDNPKLSMTMGKKGRVRVQEMFEMQERNLEMRMHLLKWITEKT
jgi:glycosyltransferase involved in cell wall biosynthesis